MTGCIDGTDKSLLADLEAVFAGDAGEEIEDIEDELRDISREVGIRIRAVQENAGMVDRIGVRAPPDMIELDADAVSLPSSGN